MDPVTSAQYQMMKDSFSRQGTEIEVAYTPAGGVHHIHAAGRLLAVDRDDNVQRLQAALPGLRRAESSEQPGRPAISCCCRSKRSRTAACP